MVSQMVEGRCVMGVWCRPPQRRPFTVSVHLPFTFYACGLFANNRYSRAKTPVCVTTMLVRVVTLSTLQQDFLPEAFRWYCNE